LSYEDCTENALCVAETSKSCSFDMCSEGNGMNDDGAGCLLLFGCGYEISDNTCKVATAKFGRIVVGSVLGTV
jgi:hypothetical protein